MELTVHSALRPCPADPAAVTGLAVFLAGRARRRLGTPAWGTLSLVLAGDRHMRAVNRDRLRRDETTDVISFRFRPLPGEEGRVCGEIFVNAARARLLGRRTFPREPQRELALYIAHGIDHLTGAGDAAPRDRDRMRRRELRWVREAARAGLLAGLLPPPRARRSRTR